ncbi:von Willebrand factor A domain-containing protein 5A-like [Haliotis rufescens]|uniref:von Willebrand factor A domain-containing protein 5A-like n=1 Tax=Haliotis rufescens TaxID=6454 RepID=UPI00201F6DE4|nr:von Willebrand factor A domain-containing protein 5A-like [Haliotis rufescens]
MAILSGLVIGEQGRTVPLTSVDVSVSVQGFLANVDACINYRNVQDSTLDVAFVFPMDDNSVVYKLVADIDDRHYEAKIQEKEQARETYTKAVAAGGSAVLMEEHDASGDIFRCKLGNLPPDSDAKLQFSFVTELAQETDGSLKFVLPTVLNPRYNPSKEDDGSDEDATLSGVNASGYSLTFRGTVVFKHEIARVWSITDRLTTAVDGGIVKTMTINLAESFSSTHNLSFNILYGEDYGIQTSLEKGNKGSSSSLLQKDILMLSFYPNVISGPVNAEFIFILDRSGSMNGKPIRRTQETLLCFLKSLPSDCYFNVISFGSGFSPLFPRGSERYGPASLKKAMELQEDLRADMGGSEFLNPLRFVLEREEIPGYTRQVFLLTDGNISSTNRIVSLVKRKATSCKVFTVGIGAGVSTSLVRNVAKAGGGLVEFVRDADNLHKKVMKLLRHALHPVVTDLDLTFDLPEGLKVAWRLPRDIPVMFNGEIYTVYAIVDGEIDDHTPPIGTARVSGKVGEKAFTHTITFDVHRDTVTTSESYMHRMAIKALIKHLEVIDKEFDGAKKNEIVTASMAGNVVSKYTSFVGVDILTTEEHIQPITRQKTETRYESVCEADTVVSTDEESPTASEMVTLQENDGAWMLTGALCCLLNVHRYRLMQMAVCTDFKVWATGLAICWLTLECADERSVWEMVVNKARDWLVGQLGGQEEVDRFLKEVQNAVFTDEDDEIKDIMLTDNEDDVSSMSCTSGTSSQGSIPVTDETLGNLADNVIHDSSSGKDVAHPEIWSSESIKPV